MMNNSRDENYHGNNVDALKNTVSCSSAFMNPLQRKKGCKQVSSRFSYYRAVFCLSKGSAQQQHNTASYNTNAFNHC